MRILMVSTDRNILASDSQVRERMVQYGKICDELLIILFTKDGHAKSLKLSSNVTVYPTNSLSRWFYIWDAYLIGTRNKNFNPTLITAQDPGECGLAAFFIARFFKIPLQIQIHTDIFNSSFKHHSLLNRFRVFIAGFLIPEATCVRAVSGRIEESLKKKIKRLAFISVLPIIHNFSLDNEEMDKNFLKILYPKFDNFVLCVGRLEAEKNFELAIKSFAHLATETNRNVALVIAGEGSLKNYLKKLASSLGIGEKVFFIGSKSNLRPYYESADLLLCTSDYEGYSLVLIEAASNKLPIVSTDVGVVGFELSKDSIWLIEERTPDLIARLMDGAIVGDEEKVNLAYEYALKQQITPEAYLEKMKEGFEQCVK